MATTLSHHSTELTHHTGPVTLSPSAYERLLAAEDACFAIFDYIQRRPMRSAADAMAEDERRDAAKAALTDWARLAQRDANGGPR